MFLPFNAIKTKQLPLLPFYHSVSEHTPLHIKNLYSSITPEVFEQHLDFFVKHYVQASNIADLYKPNRFLLSFDDGLSEIYKIAYPIMKRKGIKAVIFVNPAFIDNRDLMYRYKASLIIEKLIGQDDIKNKILQLSFLEKNKIVEMLKKYNLNISHYLKENRPYMTLQELRQMANDGFIIGMHSYEHSDYRYLTDEERYNDIRENIKWHRKNFPDQPLWFAFPFTDNGIPESFFKTMKKMGIEASFGTAGIKKCSIVNNFQRIPMEKYNGNIRRIIGGEYVYSFIRRIFGKNKVFH